MPRLVRSMLWSVLAVASAADASAQCAITTLAGQHCSGVANSLGQGSLITSLRMWDPDGPGPAVAQLIVAGRFNVAGNVAANSVVAWDPVTQAWSPLGAGLTGISNDVNSVIVLPSGELLAGGNFTTAGGFPANCVASWNGASWSALGGNGLLVNMQGILAMTTLPNGTLIVAGDLGIQGGASTGIVKWNGTAWSDLPGLWGTVYCLAVLPNGDLVAGGKFGLNGASTYTDGIARWNGSTWSALATGLNERVQCLSALPNGDLVAGGAFTTIAGIPANHVARWNGTSWSSLSAGTDGPVFAFTTLPNGDLVVGGKFTAAGGLLASHTARWNGTTWSAMGTGPGWRVSSMTTLANGDVLAGRGTGAIFFGSGEWNDHVAEIARWDGTSWSLLTPGGLTDFVEALVALPNGDVVAGGRFTRADGAPVNRIARWNGTAWSTLGSGMNDRVYRLVSMPNGDVIAAGAFTTAGGVAVNNMARWDGTSWSPFGTGSHPLAPALVVLPNGDLLAATTNAPFLERWDGVSWSPFATATSSAVGTMAILPSGDLAVAHVPVWVTNPGPFPIPHTAVERWDGSVWLPMGTAVGTCSLKALSNGDLVAYGSFSSIDNVPAPGLARWNGTSWQPFPGTIGYILDLTALPNGDLVAAGSFTMAGGVPASNLARWDGAAWSAMGTGTNSWIAHLVTLPNGDLVAGGAFTIADQRVSPFLVQLTTTCPAIATTSGAGCPSSGGSNTLVATTLPWVNATFRATGTGLPLLAIVVAATSMTPIAPGAAPLATLQPPLGVAGCDLLVVPDILEMLTTSTGTAQSQLFLPNMPPLVGVTFYQQMVPIELDGSGNWIAITSTNALQLTAGVF